MSSIIQRIAIIGSGNWGSTIAKIVGKNVLSNPKFHPTIKMYVYEEIINGRKLTDIINKDHENVKYLPGHKLPENVQAISDVVEVARDADIIVFVLPHQFIEKTCQPLVGKIKPNSMGVSLIKGFYINQDGKMDLISNMIRNLLDIDCCVLMGANLANEVANECFCEATIGSRNLDRGLILKEALQTPYFRIKVVKDVEVVEICGALKNIVAVGAGICDGLKYGENTKAAVIRLGLMEMVRFAEALYPNHDSKVFFESCGIADLITTCYGGRNRRVAEQFAQTNKSIEELEAEMLGGQKLQGPETAREVNHLLKYKNMEEKFPLFTTIHRICAGEKNVHALMDALINHPEHE